MQMGTMKSPWNDPLQDTHTRLLLMFRFNGLGIEDLSTSLFSGGALAPSVANCY